MTTSVKAIPEGLESATPFLSIKDAARAIDFYKEAFGATEIFRLTEPSGRLGHAEILIGKARISLADEYPEYNVVGPQSLGGSPVVIQLYVEDVDAVVARAVAAGATVLQPVSDQFYGDRSGKVKDPFGHVWIFATRKEEVSPEEMQRRFDAFFKS